MPSDDPKSTPNQTFGGPKAVFGLLPSEIGVAAAGVGLPKFRADQVRQWVYGKLVNDPAKMTNLGVADRAKLAEIFDFTPGTLVREQHSSDGTFKILLQWKRPGWPEPALTECVVIPDGERYTACLSSQVGCPVGCKFCASGLLGLKGNLDAGEIVYQLFALNQMLAPKNARITNIVFMGMGEPMANYANVMKAIRIIHDPKCFDMGARRITVSTVGVPAKIRDMADEDLPLNLALSLHAPNEPLRRELIPWASHFALGDILEACRYYFDQTGREITLEYILLHEVNDRPEHARELAKVCKTIRANVNLIRYNEVESLPFLRPESDSVVEFQSILRNAGINAHVRKSRGRDIDAACGQLRRKAQQELVQLGKA
jgi:23S rRNA (adenine2503-C2)-methyltransferase